MKDQTNKKILAWSTIVAFGGFLCGFTIAVISGAEKQIQELFHLSSFWHGFAISSALFGTIIGALFSGNLLTDLEESLFFL